LYNLDYKRPYPIQKAIIPHIIEGKDVLGIAQSGSGKTASYILPILMRLQSKKAIGNRHPEVLVLAPSRELVIQIEEVFKMFSSELPEPIESLAVYGGKSINPQMLALPNVRFLVATPGRLLELLELNAVNLSRIDVLVLDEADKLLNSGFRKEMETLLEYLPKQRQDLLFSATLSEAVSSVKEILLHRPVVINVEEEKEALSQIKQLAYRVSNEKKGPLLRHIIKTNNFSQVLVFVSSGHRAEAVARKLTNNKIQSISIHGKLSQSARINALNLFKNKKVQVLVSTDLLSRGIDIPYMPCVINYELPRSSKDYIHRIGRTGRAKHSGLAISLVAPEEEAHFKIIQKKIKKWIDIIDSQNIDW